MKKAIKLYSNHNQQGAISIAPFLFHDLLYNFSGLFIF